MMRFILNNQNVETDLPKGTTVLDFARYHKNLKGTKIGCREGDCGACTILVGELKDGSMKYRTQTSCLMPLANAEGKHIVTVEGINKPGCELTEVQHAMVEESGTQCGFCTVGFVMSLTNFCLEDGVKTRESAVSAIDGNICRCTGYKSIERACERLVAGQWNGGKSNLKISIEKEIVPQYFSDIKDRILNLGAENSHRKPETGNQPPETGNGKLKIESVPAFIGGGTDLYVQRPEEMVEAGAENLFDSSALKFIEDTGEFIELGGSTVVTDLLVSPVLQPLFPDLYKQLKLISSTPIRNMATLAGNFINASPIGDMTAWFLGLDASVIFNTGREVALRELYLGYKQLAKADDEFIVKIRFRKNFTHFNFEKVCKRAYLDIASVNTAISLQVENNLIGEAHVSAGGVSPIPLYLRRTSDFLRGRKISEDTISKASEILQTEISPISDVRGSSEYKRLLLRQLFMAHFVELFEIETGLE